MSLNSVTLSGRLTRDPELRSLPSGTGVLSMSLAVDDRRRNQSTGEWEPVPNYFDLVMFGTRADAVSPYLHKGSKVAVQGRLRWQQWEKDGQTRAKVDVVVSDLEFMDPPQQRHQGPSTPPTPPKPPTSGEVVPQRASAHQVDALSDDDIPF